MNGIKERMAKGNLDRCVQEIKDVHEYLSKQVKSGEIPSEDDIMQYQALCYVKQKQNVELLKKLKMNWMLKNQKKSKIHIAINNKESWTRLFEYQLFLLPQTQNHSSHGMKTQR